MKATIIFLVVVVLLILSAGIIVWWVSKECKDIREEIKNAEDRTRSHIYVLGSQARSELDDLSKSIRLINNKLDPPQSRIVIREASRGDVVNVTSQVVIPTEITDVQGDEVMSLLAEDIAAQIAPMMDVRTNYDLLQGANITRARIRVVKGDTHENSRRD